MKTLSASNPAAPAPYGIHWFRRDLRVAGNPALRWNWQQHQGRVLGLFCLDRAFLSRPDFSHHRFGFFLKTLQALKTELQAIGSDLLVLDAAPTEVFSQHLQQWSTITPGQTSGHAPALITFNRDYEPFARARDQAIEALLQRQGIAVHTERDHLLIEPQELQKENKPGSYYQVYTPFARRWFDLLHSPTVQQRISAQAEGWRYLEQTTPPANLFQLRWNAIYGSRTPPDALDLFLNENQKRCKLPLPPAGSQAAWKALQQFSPRLEHYHEDRDFPDVPGTSQLSIYLKNGSLTVAQILYFLKLQSAKFPVKNGPTTYTKELAWREFYYHILYHCPRVEHEAFQTKYADLAWENRTDWFEAWKEGRTGFPIVDAGMRQLRATGWMHNRVRMIVASFLTKDLLIDWKWGERYFMEALLDGDLAPNNGGWQWAASTGCDPQPYFRIFNPWLQGEKFDPEAHYIKHWVPELQALEAKEIHRPQSSKRPIAPLVDHAVQKNKALRLYKA